MLGAGKNGMIRFANPGIVIVWSHTLPGPVKRVFSRPSPPRRMFLNPLTIVTSYCTFASKAAILPVSTISDSPGASVFSQSAPSISRNATPFPLSRWRMNPSPPNRPALRFFTTCALTVTPGWAQRNALFCAMNSDYVQEAESAYETGSLTVV